MTKEEFVKELEKINISLTENQLNQLDKYYKLLVIWNEKINLTRIIKEEDVYLKHFYDSLTLSKMIDLNQKLTLCDIGTGAGFPGIVLKIVYPNISVTLVDALQKRINFLNIVINELNLKNIVAIHSRAEEFVKTNKNKFDVVTSRAVSRLCNLITYSLPLLKENGVFLPMKANCDDEIEEIKNKRLLIKRIEKFKLPIENSNRTIIEIKRK